MAILSPEQQAYWNSLDEAGRRTYELRLIDHGAQREIEQAQWQASNALWQAHRDAQMILQRKYPELGSGEEFLRNDKRIRQWAARRFNIPPDVAMGATLSPDAWSAYYDIMKEELAEEEPEKKDFSDSARMDRAARLVDEIGFGGSIDPSQESVTRMLERRQGIVDRR